MKNIETIELGKHVMDTWYFSPFPQEYNDLKVGMSFMLMGRMGFMLMGHTHRNSGRWNGMLGSCEHRGHFKAFDKSLRLSAKLERMNGVGRVLTACHPAETVLL